MVGGTEKGIRRKFIRKANLVELKVLLKRLNDKNPLCV